MHPDKVDRAQITHLTDLPNVGKATARDLELIGINAPADLAGKDPLQLYQALCHKTGTRQDPCVLDVFMSLTHFMAGGPPQPWWTWTEERKQRHGRL